MDIHHDQNVQHKYGWIQVLLLMKQQSLTNRNDFDGVGREDRQSILARHLCGPVLIGQVTPVTLVIDCNYEREA